jgi:multiple sugar transport system ATP-binding protein
MSYLELRNVSKNFANTLVLTDINLNIEEGKFCVILGPSGCGKSTLLNLIAGLEEVTRGDILLQGRDITKTPPNKRDMAMVFQNYALYPHLSVFENMAFGLRARKADSGEIKRRIEKTASVLGIEDKLASLPRELSGGQRQRVATGRAIVRDPKLFLFDEPLSNLDARLRIELRSELIKLHKKLKKTILYVTHDQTEAMSMGETIILINDGRIQQVSGPGELYHEPANLFAASFIGIPPMNILSLEVREEGEGFFLADGGLRLPVPDGYSSAMSRYEGKRVYFGIRPSGVSVAGAGGERADLLFLEDMGEAQYANVRLKNGAEIKVSFGDCPQDEQKSVSVKFDFQKAYFFDEGGKRITKER